MERVRSILVLGLDERAASLMVSRARGLQRLHARHRACLEPCLQLGVGRSVAQGAEDEQVV